MGVTSFGVETAIFEDKLVTMVADALILCVTKPSAALLLTMQDTQVFVFNKEAFQLHVLSQCLNW